MIIELISELNTRGVDFIKTVDISMLSVIENRGYHTAILIGISLSPEFISDISEGKISLPEEYWHKEDGVQELSEWAANFIIEKGYKAFAQSDGNMNDPQLYHEASKTTVLPHKAIALMAGLGWIGKHNLLITPEFGSALCMCTVLTNAPVPTENKPILMPKCGECTVCKDICPTSVIHGTTWEPGMNRDEIVDVHNCQCCLKCLVHCPWTQKYMKNYITA